ncbi:dTMP kinase [Nematocida major]|uniref:dTMP kinase n=1 Tax=Nematocida major TaxID=1912982 RepID=UPI002008C2BF|nr:dTMP kinase [Nematocida major]KAH9386477.1 dTMP kinase [Nematocida major]
MKKSLFVAIEGIDRSGKSSLVASLKRSLQKKGFQASAINYPNRQSHTGKLISEVLSGKHTIAKEAMHLLFSANRWEDKARLEGLLRNSEEPGSLPTVILCDRYILSGVSYSIANGLPEKFCTFSDKGMLEPDLTIFLDVPPATVETRSGFGEELYENREFQEKVYSSMKQLLAAYRHKRILNASQEEVHAISLKCILDLMEENTGAISV